jgi:hypothetical protein
METHQAATDVISLMQDSIESHTRVVLASLRVEADLAKLLLNRF